MPDTPRPLDAVDRRLVAALGADARQTNKALAEAAGVAPSTSLERVRELERRGVVRGYHADVDPAALGRRLQAVVAVRLQPKTQAVVEEFVDRVWALPETLAVSMVSGADDVLVHLGVTGTDHLRAVVLDSISNLEGVVDERTSIVFEHRRKHVIEPFDPATGLPLRD
ncbi:MAG: Lrp/AsnC family transcriptional regulator [Actinomyces sp.]|nr:MAG: Lrp/AsnC family transcriptional regulator [Actinomyces sp.]